jgi:hypothetical protein
MALSRKKVLVRPLAGPTLAGYLPSSAFVRRADPLQLDLLDLTSRTLSLPLADIKHIAFVRDFNLDDLIDPERLFRRAFLARPRSEGLWLRLTFSTGDHLEGLGPLDLSLLDGLLEDAGLFVTPPTTSGMIDARTNTQRLFIPRTAIAALQILAVVTSPSRPKTAAKRDPEPTLF